MNYETQFLLDIEATKIATPFKFMEVQYTIFSKSILIEKTMTNTIENKNQMLAGKSLNSSLNSRSENFSTLMVYSLIILE